LALVHPEQSFGMSFAHLNTIANPALMIPIRMRLALALAVGLGLEAAAQEER
jgi:hypothetical protein